MLMMICRKLLSKLSLAVLVADDVSSSSKLLLDEYDSGVLSVLLASAIAAASRERQREGHTRMKCVGEPVLDAVYESPGF